MSRSYRKNLVFPICCCNSQKTWKQHYNRTFRVNSKHKLRNYLNNISEDYVYQDVYKRPYADIWTSPSDGKWRLKILSEEEFGREDWSWLRYSSYKEYVDNFKRTILSK